MGTAFLSFLLARKISPSAGTATGLIAAVFFLQSPAHRVFATEVMLESLCACFTILVLLLHAKSLEAPSPARYRALGLALTALFFTKYNYWLLAVLALLADAACTHGRRWWEWFRAWWLRFDGRRWMLAQVRHPLTYAILSSCIAIAVYPVIRISMHERAKVPANLIHLAFVLLALRVALAWWRCGKRLMTGWDAPARQIALWHGVPLLAWFLLPKHLGYFLLYISPWNGPNSEGGIIEGLSFYGSRLIEDFHLTPWSAAAGLALAAAGAISLRGAGPGARAVVFFALIATVLTAKHPNRKSRFLITWLPAVWVLSGTGAAALIAGIRATRWPKIRPRPRGSGRNRPDHTPLPRPPPAGPFAGEDYLPRIERSRSPAFFSTVPISFFFHWTYLERYPDRETPILEINRFDESAEANRIRFREWLDQTPCDTVVFVDIPKESHFYFPDFEHYAQYRELIQSQSIFAPRYRKEYPQYGCSVTILVRASAEGPGDVLAPR